MGTIFCATDLSEAADEAIRQACDRARAEGAELVVFHAIASPPPYDPFFPHVRQGLGELRAREDEAAIAVAKRVTACTGLASSAFRVVVAAGAPYAAIVQSAEAERADVIVVASRGRTGLAHVLLGSVAERVVRHAHCPVLVARPSPVSGDVCAATDCSDPSLPAVTAAIVESRSRGVRLALLYVVDRRQSTDSPPDEARRAILDRLRELLAQAGAEGEALCAEGSPAAEVVRIASERGASLVVVGTHGRTGLRRMLIGSVAEEIVRSAPCSVLAARVSTS